jgi:plastocyanin
MNCKILPAVLLSVLPLFLAHRTSSRGVVETAPKPLTQVAPQTLDVSVGPGFTSTFVPSSLTITAGDTVKWTWNGNNHTVTSGDSCPSCAADNKFCSTTDTNCGAAPASNSSIVYSHLFGQAGTYPYFCRIHGAGGMKGTITVNPSLTISGVSRSETGMNAGHFTIDGVTTPSVTVTIKASQTLNGFNPLTTTTSDNNGNFHFDDADAASIQPPLRFYQVMVSATGGSASFSFPGENR